MDVTSETWKVMPYSLSLVLLACSERASCHGCCAQGEPHVASKPTGNWILPTSTSVRLESDPPWWSFETSCHLEAVLRETLNERMKLNCLQIPLPQKLWDKMLFWIIEFYSNFLHIKRQQIFKNYLIYFQEDISVVIKMLKWPLA